MTELNAVLAAKLEKIYEWTSGRACVVAFSGGVDSATLAKVLTIAFQRGLLKVAPVGYFAESATSTALERSEARRVANEIGLLLRTVESSEFDEPRFVENNPKRCYWCKRIRFSALKTLAQREVGTPNQVEITLVDGSNFDDNDDYRPGVQAAREVGVVSPLAEVRLTKSEIRQLAEYWGLSVAQKPSTPCLATRIAYNIPLEDSILRKIEGAEIAIKELGASTCRARVDAYDAVRIEVPESEIKLFLNGDVRKKVVEALLKIGFNFISLDLEGFASGKNNRSIMNQSSSDLT